MTDRVDLLLRLLLTELGRLVRERNWQRRRILPVLMRRGLPLPSGPHDRSLDGLEGQMNAAFLAFAQSAHGVQEEAK